LIVLDSQVMGAVSSAFDFEINSRAGKLSAEDFLPPFIVTKVFSCSSHGQHFSQE
jgi:hypothetical protein